MYKVITLLFVVLLLFTQCDKQNQRHESNKTFNNSLTTNTDFSKNKLNPEKFLQISFKLNAISKKYQQNDDVDEASAKVIMEKMDQDIQGVYSNYGITEDEFNKFGELHFREIELYLRDHPEIEKKLH
jgi:hypothetical protein